ncbi:MAG: hypothetical protein ACRBF0_00080 [Calditrichia bacterium]
MFGKGALIVVMGFSIAFSMYQLKLNSAVLSTRDSFNAYYMRTQVQQTALNSINYGLNQMWLTDTLSATYELNTALCSSEVVISTDGLDTVKVVARAWGSVFNQDEFVEFGRSMRMEDSIVAFFSYQLPASRYFWFTNTEGNVYWVTGDTITGPLHTNDIIRTYGSPVFEGKVTAQGGITPDPSLGTSSAVYNGGWEVGGGVSIPTDVSTLYDAAVTGNNGNAVNTVSLFDETVELEFLDTGEVVSTLAGEDPDTVALSVIAPTGVIYSTADVRVKGILDGRVSIYSGQSIYIDDDMVYKDSARDNPNSNDLLGLVANDNIVVADNTANNENAYIEASMIAMTGEFMAENHRNRDVSGTLYITGSVMQSDRGAVATFDWADGSILSGFQKNYVYDERLQGVSPPYFPFIRSLSLIAWWE